MTNLFLIISIILLSLTALVQSKNIDILKNSISGLDLINDKLQRELDYKTKHIEISTRRLRESLIGAKVIVKSNEEEPYHIGVIQRFEQVTMALNETPVIVYDNDPKEYMCFGAVVPYNENTIKLLDSLSIKDQWEAMKNLGLYWE